MSIYFFAYDVLLSLDSYVFIGESYFKSSKMTSWTLCNSKSSIICIGFVVTNVE